MKRFFLSYWIYVGLLYFIWVYFPDASKASGEPPAPGLKPYISLSSDTILVDWGEEADSIFVGKEWYYPERNKIDSIAIKK